MTQRTEGRRTGAAPQAARAPMVPAVTRALTLLERLAQLREPMTLAKLATDLALPKSSVHGLCSTMLSLGYLRRQPDGAYLLGPRVMGLAEAFVAGTDVAQEFNALWAGTAAPDETVILSLLDGADVIYIAVRNGSRPLGLAFTVGMRLPAHLAATGQVMLAYCDPQWVRKVLPSRLPRMTGHGPVTTDDLLRELQQARRRGYSIDDEAVREGVFCYGVPVFDAAGRAVAGLGMPMHKPLLGADRGKRHLERLIDVARTLSLRLGGTGEPAPLSSPTSPTEAAPKLARRRSTKALTE